MRARGRFALTAVSLLVLARAVAADAPAAVPAGSPRPGSAAPADGRQALGRWADAVASAPRVETARLRSAAPADVARTALHSPERIGGYPLAGPLQRLGDARARRVKELLLDPGSYSEWMIRCRDDVWMGVRFSTPEGDVELALGATCQRALWVWPGESGSVQRWGGTLELAVTDELVRLLSGSRSAE
jgi:hypothetical protein